MRCFNIFYIVFSIIAILFQAIVIPRVFTDKYSDIPFIHKVRKFFEQFISSISGYALLYYIIRKCFYAITKEQYTIFNIADIFLLIIALIGISGFLSLTIYNMSGKINEILKK